MTVTFLRSGSIPPQRRNLAAVGFGVVAAVAMTVAGSVPIASAQVAVADWLSRVAAPIGDIHKAENAAFAVIEAPSTIDADKLLASCRQLRDSNERLRNGMPTPDPKLTVEVQQAIDNFESAAQSCIESVLIHSVPKLTDFVSFLATAEQHLSRADTILVTLAPAG
ncbi:hypothetical protein [Mycobacterium sp. E3198]|uniref:hypothetical protein n=1 Tax=Mycobacterium sp. E3198 TaxID=1834143 RepID=UPI0012EA63B1|nr:hypothetical protein [Mycobacterium sp. E3198]